MNDNTSTMSYLAIVAALLAASTVSSVWYSPLLFGKQWMELSGVSSTATGATAIPAWKMLIDLVRESVVIYVLARLVNGLGIVDWKSAVSLGFWVWLGFPVQMLVGASLWDHKPWVLDLIHAGDWLMKMLVIVLILQVVSCPNGSSSNVIISGGTKFRRKAMREISPCNIS